MSCGGRIGRRVDARTPFFGQLFQFVDALVLVLDLDLLVEKELARLLRFSQRTAETKRIKSLNKSIFKFDFYGG